MTHLPKHPLTHGPANGGVDLRQARLAGLAMGLKNGRFVTFKGYAGSFKKARNAQSESMYRGDTPILTALTVDSAAG